MAPGPPRTLTRRPIYVNHFKSMKVNKNLPRLLENLKDRNEPVSGEELSASFGITRVALWKQIQALRALGCDIRSNRRGYWLASGDEALPWLVAGSQPVHYFPQTSSTMDEALALALDGAEEGTVVAADQQSKGRGTQGRTWDSPPGGLYFTLVLRRPLAQYLGGVLALNMLTVVVKLLRDQGAPLVRLQWPNDIFLGTRKVGGLLLESYGSTDSPPFWLAGLGLDVRALGGEGPSTWSRRELLTRFRDQVLALDLGARFDWESLSWPRGTHLTIELKNGKVVQGPFQGYNDYADLAASDRHFRFGETQHVKGDIDVEQE